MKPLTLFVVVLVAVSTVFIAGCTQPQGAQPTPKPTPQTTTVPTIQLPDTVRIADTSFGKVLTDTRGKTLYYFTNDVQASGASTCNGPCTAVWPVFFTDAIRVSTPLNPADFASITRADGTRQTSYRGRPLYFYSGDTNPGDVNGEGINKVWYVANVAGTVPTTPPTPTPTAIRTPSLAGGGGGGGGY